MKTFLTLVTFFGAMLAHAGEGFFPKSELPPNLLSAWESTFFISPTVRGQIGSAFVFKEVPDSDPMKVQLYFLASDHVVSTICGKKIGYCDSLILSASVGIDLNTLQDVVMDSRMLTVTGVEVVHREAQADLSMLKIIVDKEKYKDIKPIPFVENCRLSIGQDVFIIGFPATADRVAPDALPIENKNQVIRRFSRGYVVDNFTSDSKLDDNTSYWTGTTADALESNSGGPALLSSGRFFGVVDSASLTEQNGFKYTGDEKTNPMDWHSLITRCELMKDFMEQKPLSFLSEIKSNKTSRPK